MTTPTWHLHQGDAADVLANLPAASVHCVVTSPPYLGLRRYLPIDSPDRDLEIGGEATLDDYLARLTAVFRAVRRVLRPDGTLWIVIGDSYAHRGRGARDAGRWPAQGRNDNMPAGRPVRGAGLKTKDRCLIPERLALALQAEGWWVRDRLTWLKPSPMCESVTDRFTQATETIWLLSPSARYYFDAAAVAEPAVSARPSGNGYHRPERASINGDGQAARWQPAETRHPRNWWHIGPEPLDEPHFAAFPTEIARRAVLAGTSERGVCPACGSPWRRVTTVVGERRHRSSNSGHRAIGAVHDHVGDSSAMRAGVVAVRETVGWRPGCRCPEAEPVPATVLDPFLGSGTTILTALRHGRSGIGVDLNPDYLTLARRRIVGDAPLFNVGAEVAG